MRIKYVDVLESVGHLLNEIRRLNSYVLYIYDESSWSIIVIEIGSYESYYASKFYEYMIDFYIIYPQLLCEEIKIEHQRELKILWFLIYFSLFTKVYVKISIIDQLI